MGEWFSLSSFGEEGRGEEAVYSLFAYFNGSDAQVIGVQIVGWMSIHPLCRAKLSFFHDQPPQGVPASSFILSASPTPDYENA
jgi:hypothetical protein